MSSLDERTDFFSTRFPDQRHTGATTIRQAQLVMLRILKIFDYICQRHQLTYWLDGGTLLGAVRHQGFIPWDDDIDIAMPRLDYEKFLQIAESALPADVVLQTRHTEQYYPILAVPAKLRDTKSLFLEGNEEKIPCQHQGVFLDIFPHDEIPDDVQRYHAAKRRILSLIKLRRVKQFPYPIGGGYLKRKLLSYFYTVAGIDQKIQRIIAENTDPCSKHVACGYDASVCSLVFPKDCIFPLVRHRFEDGEFPVPGGWDQRLTLQYGDYRQLPPESERCAKHAEVLKPILD